MRPLNLSQLVEASEKVVEMEAGDVRVRRLSRIEWATLVPAQPPEAATWKPEEAVEREIEWLDSLPPTVRVARRSELLEAMFAGMARVTLEPVMTVDQVKRLGDDAFRIWKAIQDFWEQDKAVAGNGADKG